MNLKGLFALAALLVAAGAFILLSSASLPPIVATHFIAGGSPNGFMLRAGYIHLILALTIALPIVVAGLSALVGVVPIRYLNLPNRDYWLSPERRTETIAYIRCHGLFFAALLAVFLCFGHWLVVRANELRPPLYPEQLFLVGLAIFLAAVVAWAGVFFVHFLQPAQRSGKPE